MADACQSEATFFSVPQLKIIMAWSSAHPLGFSVRIMTDHEDFPELAELYTHDRMSPLWFLHSTQAGTAVIIKASGADQELGTVEEALARVLELESLASTAICPTRARAQRGEHRNLRPYGP